MSDHGGEDDELAFPSIFRRLSQRAAAGGRGRLSHNPVMLDADFLCFIVPASRTVMVDRALKAVWLDVWAACAGELLPLGLCVRESPHRDDVVADAGRTLNKAALDAVPDIIGCGTIPNRKAQDLPHVVVRALSVLYNRDPLEDARRLPPHHPALRAYEDTKSFVFYLHEHAAHMPLPVATAASVLNAGAGDSSGAAFAIGAGDILLNVGDSESKEEVPPRCPSAATLKKVCTRIMLSARAGAPLGLHGDFSLSAIGLTRQRRKVLRHVVVIPGRPLSKNVLNLGLDELYADHDFLMEKGDLERSSIKRRDAAHQMASSASPQPRRVPTPPPGPPMMRQVASQQRLNRFRPLAARFDWDSDDDSDDANDFGNVPTPGDYEDFAMSRQQSLARVRAENHRAGDSDSEATISRTASAADARPPAAAASTGAEDRPEAFYEAARHLSTLSFDDDAADEEFIPTFSRAADCTMRVRLVCAECRKLSICSSGYHILASGCSGLGTHVVCADCMNHRVSDLVAHGFTSLDKVPCLRDDCFGDHYFDDFAGILNPTVRRFWCRQSMAAAREAATRDVQKRLDDAAAAGSGAATTGPQAAAAALGGDATVARLQREALL